MGDFLSAFGAMDVGELEFDDVEAKRAVRRRRFEDAFRIAKETYTAKIDSDGWFLDMVNDGISDDPALSQEGITYHYYKQDYQTALEWSISLLRHIKALGESRENWNECEPFPPHIPPADPNTNAAVGREVIDTALLCIINGAQCAVSDANALIADAFFRVRAPSNYIVSADMGLAAARAVVRRGGVEVLCSRLAYYLAGNTDMADDEIEAPRSVRSL
ncbi:hypothetical protein MCUN1_000919 [Malassezia cuniculi]|uniref:Uncharacterized protein n=1 Tax=Malassezia cuniculi TaxID=948313 RepID=A0AAF0EWK4_9BASI|nr:hypothetical protein MCUN1_000919 [Malassezia cuniculi]